MRRVRRKGGNKEKVFGCDLLEHLTASSHDIPQVLRCCSEFVESNGIVDGIYRLSGVSSNIHKLRSEFESDGSPDLNKDVYLQDIHCVSSLCKAYFRELPNPLLTYQLYDKFAEAVAIQLEEERLVKIQDVLKELPAPHYRTLKFLMRHLVRMASFSSETNMHARNLAIVWAPNLLRSKDIEAAGFNGTAAFMEVRVQSIVVEFILTHVPQLFPEIDVSNQRRKSLPSPSVLPNQEEAFTMPVANYGNISPGDGPLPIRPYHAIIEGTDKRKGSLKGRKWMSIFNIGGRFHDQRRRHKHSAKEKDRPALRPARSMDSLSNPPYTKEGSRHPAQLPPPTHVSPVAPPVVQSGSENAASTGATGGCSEYAVTYRRGTGLVSGGAGTQGTYTSLDPEASSANEAAPSRSPGLSTKVGRRAAMHITGPTMVTVPLHITSNLALGVLQGGGGDRVIHRGREKEGVDRVGGGDEGEKAEKKESKVIERKAEEKNSSEERNRGEDEDKKSNESREGETGEVKGARVQEEEDKRRRNSEQPPTIRVQSLSEEQRPKSLTSNDRDDLTEDDEPAVDDDHDYIVMRRVEGDGPPSVTLQPGDDGVFSSAQVDDQELSGYIQDNFDFLDQMDCSALDHMDCSVSYQVNEFSVEPPGHSDDEYEVMEPEPACFCPAEAQTHLEADPEARGRTRTKLRPPSLRLPARHAKSRSLPHMTSPVLGANQCGSEEESAGDDSADGDSSCEEDEGSSSDFFLSSLAGFPPDAGTPDGCSSAHLLPSCEGTESQSPTGELSEWVETTDGGRGGEDEGGLGEQEMIKKEEEEEEGGVNQEQEQLENNMQRRASEEHLSAAPDPQTVTQNSVESSTNEKKEEKEGECPPHATPCAAQIKTTDAPSEESRDSVVTSTEHLEICDQGDSAARGREGPERADYTHQPSQGMKEGEENIREEPEESSSDETAHKSHVSSDKQDGAAGLDIWDMLQEVVCEVIECEESQRSKGEGAEVGKDGAAEQAGEFSNERSVEAEKNDGSEGEDRYEVQVKSPEANEGKPRKLVEDEVYLPRRSESGKANQEESAGNHSGEEGVPKRPEKEKEGRHTWTSLGEGPNNSSPAGRGLKGSRKKSPGGSGGVGRKVVVSKHPKVYQVKAVPVVPPKPQHCKITTLNLRQQHRETSDAGGERGVTRDGVCCQRANVDGSPVVREGGDRERDRRRDGAEAATRDSSRDSPLSMCFDEAVAIATMRRERERREGEGEVEVEGTGK